MKAACQRCNSSPLPYRLCRPSTPCPLAFNASCNMLRNKQERSGTSTTFIGAWHWSWRRGKAGAWWARGPAACLAGYWTISASARLPVKMAAGMCTASAQKGSPWARLNQAQHAFISENSRPTMMSTHGLPGGCAASLGAEGGCCLGRGRCGCPAPPRLLLPPPPPPPPAGLAREVPAHAA